MILSPSVSHQTKPANKPMKREREREREPNVAKKYIAGVNHYFVDEREIFYYKRKVKCDKYFLHSIC